MWKPYDGPPCTEPYCQKPHTHPLKNCPVQAARLAMEAAAAAKRPAALAAREAAPAAEDDGMEYDYQAYACTLPRDVPSRLPFALQRDAPSAGPAPSASSAREQKVKGILKGCKEPGAPKRLSWQATSASSEFREPAVAPEAPCITEIEASNEDLQRDLALVSSFLSAKASSTNRAAEGSAAGSVPVGYLHHLPGQDGELPFLVNKTRASGLTLDGLLFEGHLVDSGSGRVFLNGSSSLVPPSLLARAIPTAGKVNTANGLGRLSVIPGGVQLEFAAGTPGACRIPHRVPCYVLYADPALFSALIGTPVI